MLFPKLRTDAVAQYPATKSIQFENQAVRFLDGAEQRYRDSSGPRHEWEIRFDRLDESEIAALEQFFAACQGSFGSFAFINPWDGHVYPDCSLSTDELGLMYVTEMNSLTLLTIVENRV